MTIAGLQKVSFSDYPGKVASVLFTQGCNFNCPFCHNRQLIPMTRPDNAVVPNDDVLAFLDRRYGKLTGVVVSGGEPTLQENLDDFLRQIKRMGYVIKLDTNGSRPEVIEGLLRRELLDAVAMDIKAPWDLYDKLSGIQAPKMEILKTIDLLKDAKVRVRFRTTMVDTLLTEEDIEQIRKSLPEKSSYTVQPYKPVPWTR